MKRLLLLFTFAIGSLLASGPHFAGAADFATVPTESPLYEDLAKVAKTGWLGTALSGREESSAHPLTRYEMALETTKAIFTVAAHADTEANWIATASRPALSALRSLSLSLRPELRQLGIDVAATVSRLDQLIAGENTASSGVSNRAAVATAETTPVLNPAPASLSVGASASTSRPGARSSGAALGNPLSRRLLSYTVLSAASRENGDPLGEAAWMSRNALDETAGAAFSPTNWLQLRAGLQRAQTQTTPFGDLIRSGPRADAAVGGGIDIHLTPGLRFSADVARINADEGIASNLFNGTRVGGGVGLSAWQNRLVLNANMARLIPEDAAITEATAAELNLGLNVSDTLRLQLLYQQLFSAQNQTRNERLVAGGMSIQF